MINKYKGFKLIDPAKGGIRMEIEKLTKLVTVRRFFDIPDDGQITEGTKAFLDAMIEKKYSDGDVIVEYGASADDGMYIIVNGQADVLSSDGENINELQEGDIIGEMALINDDTRKATVKAKGEVVCANITKNLFEEIIIYNRKIIGMFLNMLYKRTTQLVTERNEIIYLAEHDQLTGLYNKGKYLDMCKNTFPNLDSIGIFNMDVNNLKTLNDTYGHEAGDKLLIKAADSIKAVTNQKVYGFRMGGDEYLMIAMNVTEKQVENIRANWEAELEQLNKLDDGINCVIAVGVVYAKKPYDYAAIFKQADELMYEDKKAKKKPGEEIR